MNVFVVLVVVEWSLLFGDEVSWVVFLAVDDSSRVAFGSSAVACVMGMVGAICFLLDNADVDRDVFILFACL